MGVFSFKPPSVQGLSASTAGSTRVKPPLVIATAMSRASIPVAARYCFNACDGETPRSRNRCKQQRRRPQPGLSAPTASVARSRCHRTACTTWSNDIPAWMFNGTMVWAEYCTRHGLPLRKSVIRIALMCVCVHVSRVTPIE